MTTMLACTLAKDAVVRDAKGAKVGAVHSFMVEPRSGHVAYAVISLGGFLGLGQKYHPLPWQLLTFDPAADGYLLDLDKTLLEGSPSYRPDSAPTFDEAYGQRIRTYYGVGGSAVA